MSNKYQLHDTKNTLHHLEKLANHYLSDTPNFKSFSYNQKQINYLRHQVVPIAQYQEYNQQLAQQVEQMADTSFSLPSDPEKIYYFQLVSIPISKYHHQKSKT